jgi:thermosome
MGGQPLFILTEDSERTSGEDAQSMNITAGKAVAESVRTTLGPRGMDKMLVSDSGDVVITNDGATILDEMDIEHPAAEMIVEVAQTQEDEVGDGTTTASVLAGRLLAEAEDLLDDDVHPTTIVEGYHEAAAIAREAVDDQVLDVDLDDDRLQRVAETSMTGKGTGDVPAARLAETVVDAVRSVTDDDGVHRDEIRVHTEVGASSSATELIEGVLVDEEPANDSMPDSVEDASVALLNVDLDVREAEIDVEYDVTNPDQLNAAIAAEDEELRSYAQALADAGVDVVFNEGDIEDRVASFLAEAGILAFEGLSSDDIRALSRATGASVVGTLDDLTDDDLGNASGVSVETYDDDDIAFVEAPGAETVTVFVRGGTEHVADELERAIGDALDVVTAALDAGGIVPGAGNAEIAISDALRDAAASIQGRKQLAVEAYADAVDVLPRTLAENAGIDPIDALVDLRSAFEQDGRAGISTDGESDIADPVEAGVFDPAAVKHEAIESATEAATMIARIDDVISAD